MDGKALCLVLACHLVATLQASEPSFMNKRPTNPLWQSTWKDKLKQDLLLHYDKFARPLHEGNTTVVNMDLTIKHIELDEKRSVITIHCWMKMLWNDDKIRWNVSDYNGLKELHMAEHELWQPDVFPYDSAAGNSLNHYGNTNLIGYWNGTVLWVPPSIFTVFCPMDFTRWPFDTQICSLKIGSWTYNGEQIDLTSSQEGRTLHEAPDIIASPHWEFVKMSVEKNSVTYSCCPIPYKDVTFNVTIRRHSATYRTLIVTPTAAIVLITLASFLLPPTAGDKITLTSSAAIINCMILLFFMYTMPATAGVIPHIITFCSASMYFVSLAVVLAVVVYNLANNPKLTPLPWTIRRHLKGWLGKCLLINPANEKEDFPKAEEMTESQPVLTDQEKRQAAMNSEAYQKEWIALATAADRMFLLIYSLAFLIMVFVYFF